jgi:hypothetical protein
MNHFIKSWLLAQHVDVDSEDYQEVSWVIDELFDLAHNDPDRYLSTIASILEVDSSNKVLGAIGAGSMEDFFIHHGVDYIDKVINLCEKNINIKKCLSFIYLDQDDLPEDVYEKFYTYRNS